MSRTVPGCGKRRFALASSPRLDTSQKCSLLETAVDDGDSLVSGRARAALSELAIK